MRISNGPWRITFDTNPDDCNLRCIMCEDHSPYSRTQKDRIAESLPRRRMDISLIKETLAPLQDSNLTEIIPSTMGEPLLYKDFETIIQLSKDYKLKLNLTTNGTFPKKGVDVWAKLIVPIASDIKISWNGATKTTQESIMLGTRWEKVLDNLKKLISFRDSYAKENGHYCQITLQLTFIEKNVAELADVVKLGIDLGVDRIKGHHLWAHFSEIESLSMRRDKEAIIRWNKAVCEAEAIAKAHRLPNGKFIKLENIYILDEQATNDLAPGGECPFLGKEAWIAADGRFNPCCAPDNERRKLGDFGNINEQSFKSIWNSQAYQDLCKNYMQYEVCKGCNMRKPDKEKVGIS